MEMKQYGRVGVLMGGPSSEREISLKSGKAIIAALERLGIEKIAIDIPSDNPAEVSALIAGQKIDCAFLALHGRFGEDGQIQEILDKLDLPYTHSGAEASRLAMDKVASRRILEKHGLSVPRYKVLEISASGKWALLPKGMELPLVVKPAAHGSSIGLSIADNADGLEKAVALAFKFDQQVVVEEYLGGREVTVGILDNRALPVIEIVTKNRFFDYQAKYSPGMTEYIVPAELGLRLAEKIQSAALSAHQLLGCFGCSRVDLILGKNDDPVILEVNTIPGFTETSLLPKAAKVAGMGFDQLCVRLLDLAYEKTKENHPA